MEGCEGLNRGSVSRSSSTCPAMSSGSTEDIPERQSRQEKMLLVVMINFLLILEKRPLVSSVIGGEFNDELELPMVVFNVGGGDGEGEKQRDVSMLEERVERVSQLISADVDLSLASLDELGSWAEASNSCSDSFGARSRDVSISVVPLLKCCPCELFAEEDAEISVPWSTSVVDMVLKEEEEAEETVR